MFAPKSFQRFRPLNAIAHREVLAGLLVIGSALTLSACGGNASDPGALSESEAASTVAGMDPTQDRTNGPRRNFPRLVEINVGTGNTYSTVALRFQPGRGQPTATIRHSKDSIVRRPGSGKPVRLAGNHALRVAVSPAVAGNVKPLDPDGPIVAEVRVLGFFEGRTALGIGIYGTGGTTPRVSFDPEQHVLDIALRNPGLPDVPKQTCGEVAFTRLGSDAGAFNIVAQGVPCEVARNVAALVAHHEGEPYTTDSGFTCLPQIQQRDPIMSIVYTCSRAAAEIQFNT